MAPSSYEDVVRRLRALPGEVPRIVVSGNSATPVTLIRALTEAVATCRVFQINGHYDFSTHPGIICETPFVGPGMRRHAQLDYLPMRLSLVPRLFDSVRPPDAVLVHTSVPHDGKVSLGIEVKSFPPQSSGSVHEVVWWWPSSILGCRTPSVPASCP